MHPSQNLRLSLTRKCLLACLLVITNGQVLPANNSIQLVDHISLLLEAEYYARDPGPDSRIFILDDTVRVSVIMPGTSVVADLVHVWDKPLQNIRHMAYSAGAPGDGAGWHPLPLPAGGATGILHLITLRLPASGAVVIRFRQQSAPGMLQEIILERPAWAPVLVHYQQSRHGHDSFPADQWHQLGNLLAAGRPVPANRLDLEPGIAADLVFKKLAWNNDSCLEYRLSRLPAAPAARWQRANTTMHLPPLAGNAGFLLETRYRHGSASAGYYIITSPYWYQRPLVRWSFLLALLLLLASGIFFYLRYRLVKEKGARSRLQAQLQLMQNQLNPHFVYNSLGSILGLIGAGENLQARKYLETFSGMMQHTMLVANQPAISLSEDLDQMEQYMRMEQLRFHFHYEVRIDPGLNLSTIELPPQLLQPVIENAVRHGAAGLGKDGRIRLCVDAQDNDLLIRVYNNAGPGSGLRQPGGGYGVKFTREQVHKLQQLFKGQRISFELAISEHGAEAVFYFQHWLNPAHESFIGG